MRRHQTLLCIAVAASKGGSGKTSLLANLCVMAARESDLVVAIDLEAQQSLARWFELREKHKPPTEGQKRNPRYWGGTGNPVTDVSSMKGAGAEFIWLDVPPNEMDDLQKAVRAADFVVIPCKASPVDIEALGPVIEACRKFRKDFCIILSMFVKNWKLNDGVVKLMDRDYPGHLLRKGKDPLVFSLRPAYVAPMGKGMVGAEYETKAQAAECDTEISDIWKAIKKRALAAVERAGKV